MFLSKMSRDNQMRLADISFALMGAFGIFGVIADSFDTNQTIVNAPNPWLTGIGISILMLIVSFTFSRIAKLDRQQSEEYTFQILSSGAVVSVMTTLVVTFAWTSDFLLSRWLGEPSSSQILALLLGGWSVGYFIYRYKGISE
jgi:hypothetical protein